MELSNTVLEEMVAGKPVKPRAVFFEQAALDVSASKREGRRVYRRTVYVRPSQPGIADSISYEARDSDIREFREEWEYFHANRQGSHKSPHINVIPALRLEHMQELIDMGLGTVKQLASTDLVPPHLEYARQSAITLNEIFEEQYHASKEEDHSEESERIQQREDVPEVRGQSQHDHVGRSQPEASPRSEAGRTPERHGTSRRAHHSEGVNWGAVRIA